MFYKDILGRFQCPFEEPLPDANGNGGCSKGILCNFGHRRNRIAFRNDPVQCHRPLPPWICMNHLVSICANFKKTVNGGNVRLKRCANGFHPEKLDLLEIDRYEREVFQATNGAYGPGTFIPVNPFTVSGTLVPIVPAFATRPPIYAQRARTYSATSPQCNCIVGMIAIMIVVLVVGFVFYEVISIHSQQIS